MNGGGEITNFNYVFHTCISKIQYETYWFENNFTIHRQNEEQKYLTNEMSISQW